MKNIYEIKYASQLDLMETQIAIKFVKDTFQKELIKQLNLAEYNTIKSLQNSSWTSAEIGLSLQSTYINFLMILAFQFYISHNEVTLTQYRS